MIPGLAGGELPEDGFEDEAVIEGWTAAGDGGCEDGLEQEPLGVGEKHGEFSFQLSAMSNIEKSTRYKLQGREYLIKKARNKEEQFLVGGKLELMEDKGSR